MSALQQYFQTVTGGAYPYLLMAEDRLLQQCRFDTYMASGSGGQKRNRTYSAVRLTHGPTGFSTIAEESRSQQLNRRKALNRLKKIIALRLRLPPGRQDIVEEHLGLFLDNKTALLKINPKNPRYCIFCAVVLDSLFFQEAQVRAAAQMLCTSTARLSKILKKDRALLVSANNCRALYSLKPLS